MKWLLWVLAYLVGVGVTASLARFFAPDGDEETQAQFAAVWPVAGPVLAVFLVFGGAVVAGRSFADAMIRRFG